VSSPTAIVMVALAVCAVVLVCRAPPRLRRQWLGVVAVLLVAAVGWLRWPSPGERLDAPRGLRIAFIDVGQGDSVLLQVPEGAVLVDQGPPEARVSERLDRFGIDRLAALVLTHPQRDHIGGAAEILRRLDVDAVLDPGLATNSVDEERALAAARAVGSTLRIVRAGDEFRLGRLSLRVLSPDGPGRPGDDPNLHAIVLLASSGEVEALLTADAESEVTGALTIPPVEILKVAHHGSSDPGLPRLLERLRPALAVISVGNGNDYGHPRADTVAALAGREGLELYRTDRDQTVLVETDGETITVQTGA
jgi:competence protein ComEC